VLVMMVTNFEGYGMMMTGDLMTIGSLQGWLEHGNLLKVLNVDSRRREVDMGTDRLPRSRSRRRPSRSAANLSHSLICPSISLLLAFAVAGFFLTESETINHITSPNIAQLMCLVWRQEGHPVGKTTNHSKTPMNESQHSSEQKRPIGETVLPINTCRT